MAEYGTGSTGRIYIEDTGSYVDIFVDARNSATFVGSATYSWTDPLGSGTGSFSWSNGSGKKRIQRLGPFGPGQGGNVRFTLDYTGTTGLGGPTTVNFGFSRTPPASAPSQVGGLVASELTATSVRLSWNAPASDGGSAIIDYLLRLNTKTPVDGSGYVDVGHTGARSMVAPSLQPGKSYWFAVYARNAAGYSTKSADLLVTMPGRAYVGKGNAYPPASAVNVGKANAYPSAEVLVGKGGSYVPGG